MNLKQLIPVLLLWPFMAHSQTINPNQIRPAGTNGYVLTTVAGAAVWAPGGSGGGGLTNQVAGYYPKANSATTSTGPGIIHDDGTTAVVDGGLISSN